MRINMLCDCIPQDMLHLQDNCTDKKKKKEKDSGTVSYTTWHLKGSNGIATVLHVSLILIFFHDQ